MASNEFNNRYMVKLDLQGFPRLIYGCMNIAATDHLTYYEKKDLLRDTYSLVAAHIQDMDEFKTSRVAMLISGIELLQDQAGHDYRPSFESTETYDPKENEYSELLHMIYEKLAELVKITKIIEHVDDEDDGDRV